MWGARAFRDDTVVPASLRAGQSRASTRKSRSGLFFLIWFRAHVYSGYLFFQHFPRRSKLRCIQKSQPKTDQNSRNPLTAQQKKTCIKISHQSGSYCGNQEGRTCVYAKAKQVNSRFGVDLFFLQQRGGNFFPDGISPNQSHKYRTSGTSGKMKKTAHDRTQDFLQAFSRSAFS